MRRVEADELADELDAVLACVASSEVVIVTRGAEPVAQLTPVPRSRLQALVAAGRARPARGTLSSLPPPGPADPTRGTLSAALAIARDDERF